MIRSSQHYTNLWIYSLLCYYIFVNSRLTKILRNTSESSRSWLRRGEHGPVWTRAPLRKSIGAPRERSTVLVELRTSTNQSAGIFALINKCRIQLAERTGSLLVADAVATGNRAPVATIVRGRARRQPGQCSQNRRPRRRAFARHPVGECPNCAPCESASTNQIA